MLTKKLLMLVIYHLMYYMSPAVVGSYCVGVSKGVQLQPVTASTRFPGVDVGQYVG